MKKIFRFLAQRRSAPGKIASSKEIFVPEKADKNTETKAYTKLPMVFDYTAYYDDNEFEYPAKDDSDENSLVNAKTKLICLNDENCTAMLFSTDSQKYECCTN